MTDRHSSRLDQAALDVTLRPTLAAIDAARGGEIHVLWGDFAVRRGDVVLTTRPAGAVLLLPSLDALADAARNIRRGHLDVTIMLMGDTPEFVLRAPARHPAQAWLLYRDARLGPIEPSAFDRACGLAAAECVASLVAASPLLYEDAEARRTLDALADVWPGVAALR